MCKLRYHILECKHPDESWIASNNAESYEEIYQHCYLSGLRGWERENYIRQFGPHQIQPPTLYDINWGTICGDCFVADQRRQRHGQEPLYNHVTYVDYLGCEDARDESSRESSAES